MYTDNKVDVGCDNWILIDLRICTYVIQSKSRSPKTIQNRRGVYCFV